uniref:Nonribosomal peptide synthetase n=1 Tax=Xylaria sp. BCC 1067 TaxID=167374 RepID=A7RAF4_9PEZI|nr:nonribosomal peptide synthetase [Xylaria sp. BCC 1067]
MEILHAGGRPSNGPSFPSPLKKRVEGNGFDDNDNGDMLHPKPRVPQAPKTYNSCVHQMVQARARDQPDSLAICAWDGQFSYAELDTLSTSLAVDLVQRGVGPEVYVPIYSEKSCWVPVAMLAVLRAGGAFVLLDPSHPIARLEEMCRTVGATKIVASKHNTKTASRLAPEVFTTGVHTSPQPLEVAVDVKPGNVAYAIFTSGSTGRPKGVAIEHRAFCSSAVAHAAATNMSNTSRVLQFASYAFDACLTEMLTALIVGARICIPSELGRTTDLAGEAHRLQPNWALLTPSVARILDVADFTMLQTLVLGGEAITEEDVHKWAPHTNLFVAYGVSEAAVINLARPCHVGDVDHANLGFGVAVTCWVTDPDDHDRLAAVGTADEAVGELVLSGPAVGREYIGDKARTAEAFIDAPLWYRRLESEAESDTPRSKLYKTGDLCAYNLTNGSLRYIGRKDSQTKLHGQRLEVAEVEHSLRPLLPDARHLVVDVVKLDGLEVLVAFVLPETQSGSQHVIPDSPWLLDPNEDFRARAQVVQKQLQGAIPKWMIPNVFLSLKYMPLMPSGKSDRRTLRSLVATLTQDQLQSYGAIQTLTAKREPSTPIEKTVQQLWASVLQVPSGSIGLDDNFMELGGTSIHVMKLAGAARRQGLVLTVGDVFRHGSLAEMAASLKPASIEAPTSLLPFALIPGSEDRDALINRAMQICQLRDRHDIEDLYPCTPLQEGLMSLTAKKPRAYTVAFEYELPIGVNIHRFKQAWDAVVDANPILRTRFIQSAAGIMYQVVIRGMLPWESETVPRPASGEAMAWDDWQMGGLLARFCLRRLSAHDGQHVFNFTIHHALSDGWALPLLLQQVSAVYEGSISLPLRPFNHFIDYMTKMDYKTFWGRYFDDLQVAAFPLLPSVTYTPDPTAKKTLTIHVDSPGKNEYSVPNRLKLAWGILISLYTDSPDTIFGVTVAGRGAPVLGIEDMTGPTIASVPYRLCLQSTMSISDALHKVQDDSIAMMPFEQAGLQYISRLGSEAASACSAIQSLLVIQPHPVDTPALFRVSKDLAALDAFSTYAITLICRQLPGSVEIDATFDPKIVEETQFGRMLHQLRHIFQQLNPSQGAQALRDLDITSPEDWVELAAWNNILPDPVYACAHDLIRKQCELRPEAGAVCAWDGDFTYSEINRLSSSLAAYLMGQGVGPEVFVPLCFEKTRWTTIAMLGVMKTGGAFVLLDPSHPVQRLQGICRDSKAPFVLTSKQNAELASKVVACSVVIGLDWNPWEAPETLTSMPNPVASPENSIYAVFTSGSTGTPKGAKHSHTSWCTSALANCERLYLEPESRVFQFSAYAFDVSIADHLLTLVAGGCICVPKNEDILGGDLVKAINDLNANWACITPSVARIIDPSKVPGLKKLALGGEPSASEVIALWRPHAHLLNVYGPAECAILTTVHRNFRDSRDPNNVGFPTSAVCWVVDAQNEQRLAPIGTVGELLVESPIVGQGYLNNPERSAESFIPCDRYPKWLSKFRPRGTCRLYRTGDLVKYMKDGSLRYVSRSETQIKLRGQRIELGEVEYHLRQCFQEAQEVVAEVITRKKGAGGSVLTAFILPKPQIFKMSDGQFQTLAAEVTRQLELLLPIYMIPTMFIPLRNFPYLKSGKLDRKLLRTMAAELRLEEYTKPEGIRRVEPVSDEERALLELFSCALKVPIDDLSTGDHFVKLGGDSIVAMHLVALAKERGLVLSTADIFKNPTISLLAKVAQRYTNGIDHRIQPLSLLRIGTTEAKLKKDSMDQCGVHQGEIEDIYPCTPLQEGMMSLSAKSPGMFIARFRYNIPQETDLASFQNAWNQVLCANSILRTRLIQSGDDGIFQVVLKDPPRWEVAYGTVEEQESHSDAQQMTLGSPLLNLSLAPMADGTGSYQFLLTIHHSLYDGWSLPLLWRQALNAYRGQEISPQPFNRFIHHIMQVDGTEDFWKAQMKDLNAAQFPPLPHVDYNPNPSQSLTHVVADLPTYKGEHTLSVMVQLAWAVILSHYTGSDDVVFGLTTNGRSAAIDGISDITGPTVATFPLRVSVDMDKTVEVSLLELQQQTIAMMPFTQSGLHNIRRINDDTAKSCDFQSHIVVQPASVTSVMNLGGLAKAEEENFESYEGFASYAFVMLCHMQEGSKNLQVTVNYDPDVLQKEEAQRLVEQFHGVLRQLLEKQSRPIGEIEVISKEDLTQLALWNGKLPCGTYEALHDLVLQHCRKRPDAEAVSSWDGVLTYRQLEDFSARLAQHLLTFGLQSETRVVACLEKSCWSIVAFLAILRAGYACVIVDPGHPRGRIADIIGRATPELGIVSEACENLVQGLISRSLSISSTFIRGLSSPSAELPIVSPNQAAFILFTSGSTGTPKGIIMEHTNLSTSVTYAGVKMNFCPESRCLHFSSYAFDASIYEIFNTLAYGGCLCVASEHDRINNLASFICDQRVNLAILTPSTLSLMEPEDVPTVKSLVSGGEALTRDVVNRWADKVSLINGYGPAESTICSTHHVPLTGWRVGTIGPIRGGRGWIVDPSNHNKLAAIGAVGELIIEGPVVTRGYLSEPEKTAAAYIEPPHWILGFRPRGTEGRLYKSGDLAQYNPDGSLRFAGRKGSQVKLRGQRIELGEVEHHVRTCFPVTAEVVAEIITPIDGKRAPFLVAAILVGEQSADDTNSLFYEPTSSFREMSQKTKQEISNRVPSYMVPEVFFPLRRLPLSRSLKLDRRQLREACGLLSLDQIQEYSTETKVSKRAPSTSIEKVLQKIWARVLNMEACSIGVDDNWMRLGGDSIQAMRVVSQCATAGLKTSVRALFDAKTIAKMSLRTESIHSTPTQAAEQLNVPFDLSPIQQMFFDSAGLHYNHFNQSLSFRLSKLVSSKAIQGAIRWLVANHSMFRARFTKTSEGQWRQLITAETDRSYFYQESTVGNQDEAASMMQSDQKGLDIEHGPLLICRYIYVSQEKQTYLSLTVHHLIVDIVSWHIILSDIETLLAGQQKPVPPSLSFQTWSQSQAKHAAKNLHPDHVLPNYTPNVPKDYWNLSTQSNNWGDVIEDGFVLTEGVTRALIGNANHAFGTRPVEILHAVLLQAFAHVFADRPAPIIFSEGHGREPWDPNLNPSWTVGWFTTIWPADVTVRPGDSLMDIVRKTKDARRQVKSNGWAYFTSRYHHPEGASRFQLDGPMEILFNYHQGFSKDNASVLQSYTFPDGGEGQISPKMSRFSLIDVMAEVRDSQLSFNFIYNRHMKHRQFSIRDWIEQTKRYLGSAALILPQQKPTFTTSDFPLLKYSHSEMETFSKTVVTPLTARSLEIEDAYKCSPIQDGFLLSQSKVPGQYMDRFFWTVKSCDGSRVSPAKLQEAWQQVLQRHPLLRTVLYANPGHNGHYDQLVLKRPPPNMSVILPTRSDPVQQLESHQFEMSHLSPPHRLAICASPSGDVECLLEINHAVVDGYSHQLLMRDLRLAYEDKLDGASRGAYCDYVQYIDARPTDESLAYWERYLRSVEPCSLPPSPSCQVLDQDRDATRVLNFRLPFSQALREFSSHYGQTLANIFQIAWALVLGRYVNSESVCFGYMTSERGLPIAYLDDTVGPIINTHICCVNMGANKLVLDLLRENHDSYVQSLMHQHISIADRMRSAKLSTSTLFNTIMSVQAELGDTNEASAIIIGDVKGTNSTEYDMLLNIGVLQHEIDISWEYTCAFISDEQVRYISDAFQQALLSIVSKPQQTVKNVSLLGVLSKQLIGQLNSQEASPVDEFVDKLVEKRCLAQPSAQAVDAWDGAFTYEEVNKLSGLVAAELKTRGIGPKSLVPLCFEKSRWTVVAQLAVLKAGGAFLPLDTSHPVERMKEICKEAQASVVLTSEQKSIIASQLGPQLLLIDDRIINRDNPNPPLNSHPRDTTDIAYVIFTSGSTGKPKGVMISHRSLATSSIAHGNAFLMDVNSRVIQLASYAFDLAVLENLTSLVMGACVCIPSDTQKQDFVGSVAAFQANWAFFTPAVARVFDPSDFKTLRTLVVGGEAITKKELSTWRSTVNLILAYGPTECTIITSAQLVTKDVNDGRTLGRFLSSSGWVVSSDDPSQLVPIGAVGELLIEGPIVGPGYLNDPVKTAGAFIEPPSWLVEFRGKRLGRTYKTGDLVRCLENGSIQFVGRKDLQVKIRGNRIELGEVESHLRASFSHGYEAIVEVVKPDDGRQPMIVAFVCRSNSESQVEGSSDDKTDDLFTKPSLEFSIQAQNAESQMSKSLPAYMTPTVYLPLQYMPLTENKKLDRKMLRAAAALLSPQRLEQYDFFTKPNEKPTTADESLLQQIWARVLNKDAEAIGLHTNFFRLGGDSILAMQVASQCSAAGIGVTVADIFRHKTISGLSTALQKLSASNLQSEKTNTTLSDALFDGTPKQNPPTELEPAHQDTAHSLTPPVHYDYISRLDEKLEALQNEYWTNYLNGVTPCHFPAANENGTQTTEGAVKKIEINIREPSTVHRFCEENNLTLSNVLQVAWAIVLKSYINSDSVCFGYLSESDDVPIPHVQEAMGPFVNTLVCRIDLLNPTTLMNTLQQNQISFFNSLKYRHYPLADILRAARVPSGESLFNTVMSLQKAKNVDANQSSLLLNFIGSEDPSKYDIAVDIAVGPQRITIALLYQEIFMPEIIADEIANTLCQTIYEICAKPSALVPAIEVVSERSRQLLHNWSGILPPPSLDLVHNLIHEQCLTQPDTPAVDSWDGQFSYLQLDELSSKLASHLAQYALDPDTFIAVCFEKSKWTPVVMLAIMKSGAAFVLLDPSQPPQRLQYMCRTTKASVVIASEKQTAMATTFGQYVITVGDRHRDWTRGGFTKLPNTSPDNTAFAVFTSGSTGKPKGVQISHSAFITSARDHSIALKITRNSRVLQFASYTFDASVAENLTTLLAGGCICIPSDTERKQSLAQAISRMQANFIFITPALARVLDPNDFPSLKTVILGGELITEKELSLWRNKVDLYLAYGPTECTVFATATKRVTAKTNGRNIGTTINCRSWVVDPKNHERLLPVGAIGELLLEGPTVAGGYIGEPKQTAAVFIDQPPWLKAFNDTPSRAYKTGDLVRYNPDGTLHFVARKDNQVKIRGQRLELGEVEFHIRAHYRRPIDVAVELAVPEHQFREPFLVAFIYAAAKEPQSSEEILAQPSSEFRYEAQAIQHALSERLPAYMVPTLFLPLQRIPLSANDKINRHVLRQLAAKLSLEDFLSYSARATTTTQLANHNERKLQLATSAASSIPTSGAVRSAIAPFALMSDKVSKEALTELAAAQCGIPASQIEDVYPATPLQEGLIALTTKLPGQCIATFQYELAEGVELGRFVAAWNATVAANVILRTRIIQSDSLGFLQVAVRDLVSWRTFDNEQACAIHLKGINMGLATQLVDFALIQPRSHAEKAYKFYLTLHHALYDGGSLPRLLSQVQSAYNGEAVCSPPFNRFIEYVLTTERGDEFWKSEFEELTAPIFPALPSPGYSPDPSTTLIHTISAIQHQSSDYTISTVIRLAWAMVVSCYTDSDDIIHGVTVSGGSSPVEGIEDITGPTFATFPVRTRVNRSHTVQDALASIQEKIVETMPFHQFGMQNMRQLSPEAARACDFQCHLAIQPPAGIAENQLLVDAGTKQAYGDASNCAFMIVCHLPAKGETEMLVAVSYDKNIVEQSQATRIVQQFEHVLRQIELSQQNPESHSIRLGGLDLLSPEDRQQLAIWNSVLPTSSNSCLHELVLQHATERPNAPAICAWDGEMTFKDLDIVSAILSQQLQSLGIQAGSLVPLLFSKSKWAVVTLIALHRIGAVCVNIDPTYPKGRIQDIIDSTQAKLVVGSRGHTESMVFERTTLITVPIKGQQPRAEDLTAPRVSPNDIAFIVFTSGSAGNPKGVLVEHTNVTSSIRGYSAETYLDQNTRGLHCASYASEASIFEIYGVLVHGGCVCIPNELDSVNGVAPFINKHAVNWAFFTPSCLAILKPDSIPTIRTIFTGGEAISLEKVRTWGSKVNLVSGYGPAEAAICAAGRLSESWKPGTLGHAIGSVAWITMPSDRSRLAPIGTPGELAIEGAVVTRGYLGDPEKTAAAYVTNPAWLRPFRQDHAESRVFFSGDLAQYNADGTILFLGRSESQVKLRGQRIELGQVEHNVHHAFDNVTDVIAEVVRLNGAPTLIAFVANGVESSTRATDRLFNAPTEEFLAQSETATRKLANILPAHMVPSFFVQLSEIPRNSSDKADRRLLREQATKLSQEEIQAFSRSRATKRAPMTEQEKVLRSLWAQTFKVSQDAIEADANFLNLGDSIAAIRLSGVARQHGVHLPVSHIFKYPILSEQAQAMTAAVPVSQTEEYQPGSLLGITNVATFFDTNLSGEAPLYTAHDVEDILPCTSMQSSMIKEKNITYSRLQISTQVDWYRLEEACRALVRKHASLRTVFVPYRDDILQVVLRQVSFDMKRLKCDEDLWEYSTKWCTEDGATPVPLGSLHFQPILISRSESDHILVVRMTHALYDGGSFPLISKDLTSAYNGTQLESNAPSFAHFLQYRQGQNSREMHEFWREYLDGSEMSKLNMLPPDYTEAEFEFGPIRKVPLPTFPDGITMATLVKAVWSVVLAKATKRKDVVFGHLINGRDIPLPNPDAISGPCITISPFRVSIQTGWSVRDLLNHVQSQYTRSMPYTNVDFRDILKHATSWSPDTEVGSIVTHEDANIDLSGSVDSGRSEWETMGFGLPHFNIITYPRGGHLWVKFGASNHKMHPSDVELLMDQFCELIAQFSEDHSQPLQLGLD